MALRDQPYLSLYVKDIMTDEKLNECCASTHGIYIKGIMCLMHKSADYGIILLNQKDKQTDKQIYNFAYKLAKHLPYTPKEIELALEELLFHKVITLVGDRLEQKRMIKDNLLSVARAEAGSKGGKGNYNKNFAQANNESKPQANAVYANGNAIENVNEVIYPFKSEIFKNCWDRWIDYRRDIKKPYKSFKSVEGQLKKLGMFTESVAITMIEQSIDNGWQGIFEIKTHDKQTYKIKHEPISGEELLESLKKGNPDSF